MKTRILAVIALGIASTLSVRAAVNSWIDGTGKWENTNNWSLGTAPLNSDSADLITNAGNNTITLDATTSGSFPSTMTISNLTVGSSNTLSLANAGLVTPLHILNGFTITGGGSLVITNSALRVESVNTNGFDISGGTVTLNTGSIIATKFFPGSTAINNANLEVGNTSPSSLTISNGTLQVGAAVIGEGSQGTLALAGGTMTFLRESYVGFPGVTGTIWVTGGNLMTTSTVWFGQGGTSQMTISNGIVSIDNERINTDSSMTIAGGSNIASFLAIGLGSGTGTGTVQMTGGLLMTTSQEIVGWGGAGALNLQGGTNLASYLAIGSDPGGTGTVRMTGGLLMASSYEVVGYNDAIGTLNMQGGAHLTPYMGVGYGATGTVWMSGGQLIVTNQTGCCLFPGHIDLGVAGGFGQMIVSNGTVMANVIQVSTNNGQGFLSIVGGTVIVNGVGLTNGLQIGVDAGSTGAVSVGGGSLVTTNTTTIIGNNGVGSMTYSNGTGISGETDVGAGSNSQGSLFYDLNSTVTYFSNLTAGAGSGSTAQITVAGNSTISVPNGIIGIGNNGNLNGGNGFAQFTMKNASVTTKGVNLGSSVGGHGIMTIQPSAILHIVGGCAACGLSWNEGILDGGTIDATNADMFAGQTHAGEFISSNGVATVRSAFIGFDNLGSLTQVGGTLNVLSNLVVGTSLGATGIVTMTGGSVFVTNGVFAIGNGGSLLSTGGVGHVTLSNGVVEAASILIGDNFGSASSLTVAGSGSVRAHGGLRINGNHTTTVNGGTLEVVLGPSPAFEDPILHDRIVVSYGADGTMIVSNGLTRTPGLLVGASAGNTGTLQLPGGITSVFSNMTVGFVGCASTGIVNVTGGNLYVTNGGTATLEIRSGTFTLSAGIVIVDRFVMTNACAHFVRTGGTLIYGTALLDPNGDADGDGIPNGYELSHGLDPLNPADASADNDGDGLSNLQEFQAGTDPNNSASSFLITSVVKIGNDVRVMWMMGPGKTNALQWTAGTGNGSYQTNNFADLFSVTNTLGTVTNYLDVGGATNRPARYYRVRLVP